MLFRSTISQFLVIAHCNSQPRSEDGHQTDRRITVYSRRHGWKKQMNELHNGAGNHHLRISGSLYVLKNLALQVIRMLDPIYGSHNSFSRLNGSRLRPLSCNDYNASSRAELSSARDRVFRLGNRSSVRLRRVYCFSVIGS